MVKTFIEEEYILIDLDANVYKFCNINAVIINKDLYAIKIRQGKLGSSGKFTSKEFGSYKEVIEYTNIKRKTLTGEGFLKKDAIKKILSKKTSKKTTSSAVENVITYNCHHCSKPIPQKTYETIETWAKKDGNWANSPLGDYSNKVICISCQKKLELFKVKFPRLT